MDYRDYKKKMMDPVSKSFCAAKWLGATVWLEDGYTVSCVHPRSHKISLEELKDNPSALHNTSHKKQMREMMLKGERPPECEYCWKVEDMGKDVISDRVHKTLIYREDDIRHIATSDPYSNTYLRALEISFDRTCNFACSYCNPAFSTTWIKDIRTNGTYQNLLSDKHNHFDQQYLPHVYPPGAENPYITAFWQWWPELSQTLQEIRITGGEPLMVPDVWKLLDWFEKNPESKMRFSVNSNLGAKPEIIDRLIEKSHAVSELHVYTSCEAYGTQAEYIRDGLDYSYWRKNMLRLATESNVAQLHVMMTINALCLSSITAFLDDMMELKREYGHQFPTMSMNILRYPTFQSPLSLPFEIREKASHDLQCWLDKVRGEMCKRDNVPLLSSFEESHTQRLIEYLVNVETPLSDAAPIEQRRHDFKVFYEQYDRRRGKNFRATFPDLVEWYDSIAVIK